LRRQYYGLDAGPDIMVIFGSVVLKVPWSNFFSKTGDYEGSDGVIGSCILEATRIAADSCEYLEK
jgi:hypothetical protein